MWTTYVEQDRLAPPRTLLASADVEPLRARCATLFVLDVCEALPQQGFSYREHTSSMYPSLHLLATVFRVPQHR